VEPPYFASAATTPPLRNLSPFGCPGKDVILSEAQAPGAGCPIHAASSHVWDHSSEARTAFRYAKLQADSNMNMRVRYFFSVPGTGGCIPIKRYKTPTFEGNGPERSPKGAANSQPITNSQSHRAISPIPSRRAVILNRTGRELARWGRKAKNLSSSQASHHRTLQTHELKIPASGLSVGASAPRRRPPQSGVPLCRRPERSPKGVATPLCAPHSSQAEPKFCQALTYPIVPKTNNIQLPINSTRFATIEEANKKPGHPAGFFHLRQSLQRAIHHELKTLQLKSA
jgi:hypothetical protein